MKYFLLGFVRHGFFPLWIALSFGATGIDASGHDERRSRMTPPHSLFENWPCLIFVGLAFESCRRSLSTVERTDVYERRSRTRHRHSFRPALRPLPLPWRCAFWPASTLPRQIWFLGAVGGCGC